MNIYQSNKAPIQKIVEISERMHQRAKKYMERRNHLATKRKTQQENQEECTFKPNIRKGKFIKYPKPPVIKKQFDTVFVDDNKDIEQHSIQYYDKKQKQKYKTAKNKLYPPKRLTLYYRWQQKRKEKLLNEFIEQEIHKSVQLKRQPSPQRNSQSTRDNYYVKRVNRSMSPGSYHRGEQQFLQRQKIARIRKQEKQFILKNPWAHASSFVVLSQTKMDATRTNFMNFGTQNYVPRQNSRQK